MTRPLCSYDDSAEKTPISIQWFGRPHRRYYEKFFRCVACCCSYYDLTLCKISTDSYTTISSSLPTYAQVVLSVQVWHANCREKKRKEVGVAR